MSGFALDVDGRQRAAVPVEKARAQQVFEDITRRRVDPGLLQTTIGNNYELSIYPLLPGKTRTVELRIVEPGTGEVLADRQVGELQLRGTSVTPGYYKRPDATADQAPFFCLRSFAGWRPAKPHVSFAAKTRGIAAG